MIPFNPVFNKTPTIWESVGIPSRGNDLYTALNEGLAYDVFSRLAQVTQLDKKEIAKVIHLAPATLARRAKTGRFSREEGDRFYRFTEVLNAANELFEGDTMAASQWLQRPARGLGGKKPIEMLATSAESEAVLDLIGRLEHGVFA